MLARALLLSLALTGSALRIQQKSKEDKVPCPLSTSNPIVTRCDCWLQGLGNIQSGTSYGDVYSMTDCSPTQQYIAASNAAARARNCAVKWGTEYHFLAAPTTECLQNYATYSLKSISDPFSWIGGGTQDQSWEKATMLGAQAAQDAATALAFRLDNNRGWSATGTGCNGVRQALWVDDCTDNSKTNSADGIGKCCVAWPLPSGGLDLGSQADKDTCKRKIEGTASCHSVGNAATSIDLHDGAWFRTYPGKNTRCYCKIPHKSCDYESGTGNAANHNIETFHWKTVCLAR